MKIRYLYSACVSIETEDCTILCDPWFTPAYDGAWAQWPEIDKPLDACGPANYVFISHVHPDHYDPQFLEAYLKRYPRAQVLIARQTPALLERKLRSRGITPIAGSYCCGETDLLTFPNANNFDSALRVQRGPVGVVNFNDNPYDAQQVDSVLRQGRQPGSPTVALLPFVGAGPWPQAYDLTPEAMVQAGAAKKQKGLDLFRRYCEALEPTVAVPFAGQYWLHGPQLDLNPLRGMADAVECVPLWKHVWVPNDGGQSVLHLRPDGGWTNNGARGKPYDWPTVRNWLEHEDADQEGPLYRYEQEIQVPVERLPLLKLLQSAVRNASKQFARSDGHYLNLYIKAEPLLQWFHIVTDLRGVTEVQEPHKEPRYEVTLDARYLFGMLTRLYNANNVRIGSLARFKVVPQEPFDEKLYDLFGQYWDSLRV